MKDGHGHSPADVGIQGGQPVLVDLEYGEFDEKAYGIGKRLDGVLTQVEVGEVAEAVNLGGDVLQVVLGYVQTVQRRQVSDFLRGKNHHIGVGFTRCTYVYSREVNAEVDYGPATAR